MPTLTGVLVVPALSIFFLPGTSRGVDLGSAGLLLVSHTGPRPLPATATTFRLTALAADDHTALSGRVARPVAPQVALVPPAAVKISKIEDLAGNDAVTIAARHPAGAPFPSAGAVGAGDPRPSGPAPPAATMAHEVTGSRPGRIVLVEH